MIFKRKFISDERKVLINSIPKSGTYLVGKMLENAGFESTGFHLRSTKHWDWNEAKDLDEIIRNPDNFKKESDLYENLKKIQCGFTYAHLDYSKEAEIALASTKGLHHLFLYRNIRNCLVSSMRFKETREAAQGCPHFDKSSKKERFLNYIGTNGIVFVAAARRQLGWRTSQGVACFRFEDIFEVETTQTLLRSVGWIGLAAQSISISQATIGARTRTFSGCISDWKDYWSPQTELIFKDCGAFDLNQDLGYEI
jgi:hypothetical protein